MEDDATLHAVDARDGIALLVLLRIAARDEHHTDGSPFVEGDGALVEITSGHTLEEVHDVALQTEHHTLCLRVAHTAVVFDDHRLSLDIDEAEEDESLVVDALCSQTFDGRTDDAVFHLLHPILGGEGNRCHRPHAASVQTCVVLTDTLVVLGFGQDLIVLSVCQYED